jgi:hypothetical protein
MAMKAKVLSGVLLAAVGIAVALLATQGGDTPAERAADAPLQAPVPVPARPQAAPSVEARGTAGAQAPARAAPAAAAPLPPQNVPIAGYLEELKRRAKGGDVRAACRVTFELSRCAMGHGLRRLADDLRGAPLEDGASHHARQSRERRIAALEREAAAHDGNCQGVTEADSEDLVHYALTAAQGGNVRSMVHFAAAPPEPNDRNWTAWRENAATFVTRAVEAGDPAAVVLAGHMHMVPRMGHQVLPLDPVRGLAHYYALARFASPGYRTMINASISSFSSQFDVTESQRQEAMALAAEIEARIVRGGRANEGVDFRGGSGIFNDSLHCE